MTVKRMIEIEERERQKGKLRKLKWMRSSNTTQSDWLKLITLKIASSERDRIGEKLEFNAVLNEWNKNTLVE